MFRTISFKNQNDDAAFSEHREKTRGSFISLVRETIEIDLPSDLSYLKDVASFLAERTAEFGIIHPEDFDLNVALDEAITNAIKHGNKGDASKSVYVRAEISARGARFIIRDQGNGFDPARVPDPLAPENRFKPSGRGILLMRNFMDEVRYNRRGNEVTLVKYPVAATTELRKAAKQRDRATQVGTMGHGACN